MTDKQNDIRAAIARFDGSGEPHADLIVEALRLLGGLSNEGRQYTEWAAAHREGRLRIEKPKIICAKCGRTMTERADGLKYLCFACGEIREAAEAAKGGAEKKTIKGYVFKNKTHEKYTIPNDYHNEFGSGDWDEEEPPVIGGVS